MRNILETIEEPLTISLERINFMFQNEKITCICIKNHEGFRLIGEFFGPFEVGKNYKLMLFSAIPFVINDILEIISSEKCDNIDVQRYAIKERDDQKLIQPEDIFFLNKIKEFRQLMEIDIEKKKTPQINLDRYSSFSSSIVDLRMLKLLKLAKTEPSLNDERLLTFPEKKLFALLNSFFKQWRNFFITS